MIHISDKMIRNVLFLYILPMHINTHQLDVLFRTGNHFLPLETDRLEGIYIRDRTCALCENIIPYTLILLCIHTNCKRP